METNIIPLLILTITHFACWLQGHHLGHKHGEEIGRLHEKADYSRKEHRGKQDDK